MATSSTAAVLGFVGGGNMAEALIRAALSSEPIKPSAVLAFDPSAERRSLLESMGVTVLPSNNDVARLADVVVLAIKPQVFPDVGPDIGAALKPDALVVSIMAGVSVATIERVLGGECRVVRTMPNLPVAVEAGMTALVRGSYATATDLARAARLFAAAGDTIALDDENLMHAVTGVSGSGPAYFFYLIEAMTDAGVHAGLTPEQAAKLARQTAMGAAKLLIESGEDAGELRRRVTSPRGTTQAAIETFDQYRVREHLKQGVLAAVDRSIQLASGAV